MKLLLCALLTCLIASYLRYAVATNTESSAISPAVPLPIDLVQLTVVKSSVKINRTKSRILRIHGSNFPTTNSKDSILLKFDPELIQEIDFTTFPANGNGVNVILLEDRAWRAEPGPLLLTAVTSISEDGLPTKYLVPSVMVAEVRADPVNESGADQSGDGLTLYSSDVVLYQSALQQSINITGSGFQSDLSLLLDPHLEVGVDYTLTVTSTTSATLTLQPGKKWRSASGYLYVRGVKCGNAELLDLVDGIRIADVYANPAVFYSLRDDVDEAGVEHYRVVSVDYNKLADVKLALAPNVKGEMVITAVPDVRTMFVAVRRDTSAQDRHKLPLFTIDTGAGRVPITAMRAVEDDGDYIQQIKKAVAGKLIADEYTTDDASRDGMQDADDEAWLSVQSPYGLRRDSTVAVRRALQFVTDFTVLGATSMVPYAIFCGTLLSYYVALRLLFAAKLVDRVCVETRAFVEMV